MAKNIKLYAICLIISSFILVSCTSGTNSSPSNRSQTFSDISNGRYSSCGVSNNNAYCWGNNESGQLGNGSFVSESTPVAVIESVSGKFASIYSAEYSTCGLNISGQAYCWGSNSYGQLGIGSTESKSSPTLVVGNLTFNYLSAGRYHVCGIIANGKVYCWGSNIYGQLGNGSNVNESTPIPVSGNLTFISIDVGSNYTCGITTAHNAYCWGDNIYGQLGNNSTTEESVPTPVIQSTSGTFTQISAGLFTTCGINTHGNAYCWGGGLFGTLGNNSTTDESIPTAVIESISGTFKQISAGRYHICGINSNNQSFCWGGDLYGQLGDGNNIDSAVPVAVIESASGNFRQISAGVNSTCGINTFGQAFCWGNNLYGQLGIGSNTNESTPTAIKF